MSAVSAAPPNDIFARTCLVIQPSVMFSKVDTLPPRNKGWLEVCSAAPRPGQDGTRRRPSPSPRAQSYNTATHSHSAPVQSSPSIVTMYFYAPSRRDPVVVMHCAYQKDQHSVALRASSLRSDTRLVGPAVAEFVAALARVADRRAVKRVVVLVDTKANAHVFTEIGFTEPPAQPRGEGFFVVCQLPAQALSVSN
ncbi:hypothetical protein B484DRAFT_391757 [Ochromonadaceae sp. CCMP2298]|nr:hypothetical protein B484DRAFT_392480 [Ochromonadaceae sp. CCMP2298]KAJ1439421.1 hypothetical protein B484DRAFT_391757 [Ochromonadaceae sp. CCMP2298]